MALNRIEGDEALYVGGIWALKRPTALQELGITHVLSVLRCTPSESWGDRYSHMVIDVDDVEDEDLLVHLPRAVRFINDALTPSEEGAAAQKENAELEFEEKAKKLRAAAAANSDVPEELSSHLDPDAITPAPDLGNLSISDSTGSKAPGAVYVHCAMGKSRSVSAVAAYLLFKHPSRFGRASHEAVRTSSRQDVPTAGNPATSNKASRAAVQAAVAHIRKTREIAEPNDGFMRQLEMWWDMGCPIAEGELEAHPIYQKWTFSREVEESLAVGAAPTRLRFEDEERAKTAPAVADGGKELRCKKCRRALATSSFVLDHQPPENRQKQGPCQHVFVEPLGWMRPTLETAELEGRLNCPNERCGANLGRYSWKGFRCSCGGWVTPAFSLARSRVDEVTVRPGGVGSGTDAGRAALGIRMPAKVESPGRL
ncbi:dual specificity phosphatase [Plectosphaerella plurivora]|uniref:protein-tyrosine-phosphatase n=1 Tax=Plectosphaerella plurivora TaxID=936078 RepID=A0A9P8VLJ6_9PEZI|nr:dual specificity phosphatase [Plectosphaerella plurivora]